MKTKAQAMHEYLIEAAKLTDVDKSYRDSPWFTPGLLFRLPPCGCTIEGDGVIPNPFHIKFCATHAAVTIPEAEPEAKGPTCPHCGRPAPSGFITCGASECQEAEFHANQERNKKRRKS